MIAEYFELTAQYVMEYGEKTILYYQNGAFFEVFGIKRDENVVSESQLHEFSRICELNIVPKHVSLHGGQVVNAGFKLFQLEKYLFKMQEQGYTIVVFEENGEKDPVRNLHVRVKTGIYSPGTTFLESNGSSSSSSSSSAFGSNYVACIWIERQQSSSSSFSFPRMKADLFIGVGAIDVCTGYTCMAEYHEEYLKGPAPFDRLEGFMSCYSPSETMVITNLEPSCLDDIFSFIGLKSKSVHSVFLPNGQSHQNQGQNPKDKKVLQALRCEKQTYQHELLSQFFRVYDLFSFMETFAPHVYATQAFCYLLDFVYQHNPLLIRQIAEPVLENSGKRLLSANHSLKQLNIVDTEDGGKGKYSSVSRMLNECVTPMGKRHFMRRFLSPVTDETYLQDEYDITEALIANEPIIASIRSALSLSCDMSRVLRQIGLQKATTRAMEQLSHSLEIIAQRITPAVKERSWLWSYLNKRLDMDSVVHQLDKVRTFLAQHFQLSQADGRIIRNGVDAVLDKHTISLTELEEQLNACRVYFNSQLEMEESKGKGKKGKKEVEKKKDKDKEENDDEEEEEKEVKMVSIYETEKNNISLVATTRRCKLIEENLAKQGNPKIVNVSSSSSAPFFLNMENLKFVKHTGATSTISNPFLDELCRQVRDTKIKVIDLTAVVFQRLTKQFFDTCQADMENIIAMVTWLDMATSKAVLAIKYHYCKPSFKPKCNEKPKGKSDDETEKEGSFIHATGLRHCLVEQLHQEEIHVSNDLSLNEHGSGILLYGTNGVGKTSFIRAVGIAVVMAQAGLFVPATTFQYRPYTAIFTRIIGNDNLFKGMSTFVVEMTELRTILRLADNRSLVLGDELCSGTETVSAISLVVAGIQHLAAVRCSFLFATHFHEIHGYDEITSLSPQVSVKHMSVVYDLANDCLVYGRKMQDGAGSNLYGLEVCKSLHLPTAFLETATAIRQKYFGTGSNSSKEKSILEQSPSSYNASHLSGGICQQCRQRSATEVHHLVFQQEADHHGIIRRDGNVFHKNMEANMINLCRECHDAIHQSKQVLKKTKTTAGMRLTALN